MLNWHPAMLRAVLSATAIVALALPNQTPAQVGTPSVIRFEDITARSGVDFFTDSSPTPNKNQPETMVSGVGLIDYDNDGYLDIFFINGAAIPSLKKESPKYYNRLFHNN
ncbi:MAG: hypothetical protein DMG95_12170, partial [Acidobacteria bacterium]